MWCDYGVGIGSGEENGENWRRRKKVPGSLESGTNIFIESGRCLPCIHQQACEFLQVDLIIR